MADAGDAFDDGLFDPFSAAEAAGQAVLDQVLTEGGKLLYDHYIARKSFAFAAESMCEALIAEMKMNFVRHDNGEEQQPQSPEQKFTGIKHRSTAPARFAQPARPRSSTEVASPDSKVPAELEAPRPGSAPAAPDADRSGLEGRAESPAAAAGHSAARQGAGEEEQEPHRPDGPPVAGQPTTASEADGRDALEAAVEAQAPRAGWDLDMEPTRCRIDTWARACVPIRKKFVQKKGLGGTEDLRKAKVAKRAGSGASNSSAYSLPGSRSPSRFGVQPTVAEGIEEMKSTGPPSKPQLIPLIDEREEDEEEALLRDQKDREARKVRDEQVRAERKMAVEVEEAAKLAAVKDDKKNKQFTYDTEGNVIWVQPPAVHKLPSTNPAPSYSCKQEGPPPGEKVEAKSTEKKPPRGRSQPVGAKAKRKVSVEFKDGFKKFPSQQPSMLEAMTMSPGVELSERNKTKRAEKVKDEGPATMSRKQYEEMAKKGTAQPEEAQGIEKRPAHMESRTASAQSLQPPPTTAGRDGAGSKAGLATLEEEQASSPVPPEAAAARSTQNSPSRGPAPGETMKVVRSEMGADLVPRPPTTPRPVQPAPPPSARRVQSKRDALGYALSTRERFHMGPPSRFPNCAAQPPLGATMGHGLIPTENKYEEYYFPASAPLGLGSFMEGLEEVSPPITSLSPRKQPPGQIVSKNPQLKSRLFGKT